MKKISILISDGFEEGETMAVLDVLRRAGQDCKLVGADDYTVHSGNGVAVMADEILNEQILSSDMLVIPGGSPHIMNLPKNEVAAKVIREFDSAPDKYLVAICSGPVVLAQLGLTSGRKLTSYPGEKYERWFKDSQYSSDIVVVDDHLVTCRGPVSGFCLGFILLDLLGEDGNAMRKRMLYDQLRASKF